MNARAMPNDGDLLDLMLEWVPDETVRDRILAQNAKALTDSSSEDGLAPASTS